MSDTSELLRAIVACTHRPNPTDHARVDVAPGKHKAFQEAIYQAEALLSWPEHDARRPPGIGESEPVSEEAVEDVKLRKYVEMLRHECAYRGPCSDNGDGCTCSAVELNERHHAALPYLQPIAATAPTPKD